MIENLRNIAIIAHVDHGKTTLVDKLLRLSGTLDRKEAESERVMDSNDQEKERGITILAKNTALKWNGYNINIVDTPGHADFGGEVERVMSMVDSVLLVVDAQDGPMPQTRFVTQKAFKAGLRPIVVVNKIDRPGARPDWVIDQIFDLFDNLGASDEQLDFPIVYASALNGIAGMDHENMDDNMDALFQAIIDHVPAPKVDVDGPFQMQISQLDYNSFLGVIGIGRIARGQTTVDIAPFSRRRQRDSAALRAGRQTFDGLHRHTFGQIGPKDRAMQHGAGARRLGVGRAAAAGGADVQRGLCHAILPGLSGPAGHGYAEAAACATSAGRGTPRPPVTFRALAGLPACESRVAPTVGPPSRTASRTKRASGIGPTSPVTVAGAAALRHRRMVRRIACRIPSSPDIIRHQRRLT